MSDWTILLLLIMIGSIVGGGTNIIAIRMLFRPYRPWFIGSFQIPFTPGLIPKRRGEIADNLGKLVEDHLVTPEGMQEKLRDGVLFEEVQSRLQEGVKDLLQEERTLDEWMEEHLGVKDQLFSLRKSVERGLADRLYVIIQEYSREPFQEWVPETWKKRCESYFPLLADQIIDKGTEYVASPEGIQQLDSMLKTYLRSRGSVSTMFSRLAQRFSMGEIISRELVRFLQDKQTKKLLVDLMHREWNTMLQTSADDYISNDKMEGWLTKLTESAVGRAPVIGEWGGPISGWSMRYEELLNKTVIPSVLASASTILSRYIKSIMKQIGIRELVTKEVNTFPLSRLEEMLLIIAKRELKMIAVLGGLIGALVGLIQGIFILFIF
ncbi:DUF445 domain-containing protein [Alkalicoccus luteus]|uniref:DUF445 family protein n=1 Tax=Alkalicoccus luteus TaxID=1237094 RepID=A0A969TVR0_9BACI|nr:DUF445 family protein [Alkalicoccus luteus]NJP36609.1 DUF445 family protein [Alkalicoccus luteus]